MKSNTKNTTGKVGRPMATINYPKTVFTFNTLKDRNPHVRPLTVFNHLHDGIDGRTIKVLSPDRKGTRGAPVKRYITMDTLRAQRKAILTKKAKLHVEAGNTQPQPSGGAEPTTQVEQINDQPVS